MSRTSKKYWDEKFKAQIWKEFFADIKKINYEKDLERILKTILSDDEMILAGKRLAVKKLLKEGVTYREISRKIDVTRVTISFIKNNFKRPIRKKRVYSENKNQKKDENYKYGDFNQLRKYRFIPKRRRYS